MATFTFSVPPGADKKKLEALISAQLMYEQLNEARLFLIHVLALSGAPLWLCLWWPTVCSQSTRAFLLAVWSLCGLATLTVSIFQWVWYRRRVHRLAEYETRRREEAG
jgi:hypothetical protein